MSGVISAKITNAKMSWRGVPTQNKLERRGPNTRPNIIYGIL